MGTFDEDFADYQRPARTVPVPEVSAFDRDFSDYKREGKKSKKQRSLAEEAARQVGLTGRYLAEGAASLPLMAGDIANSGINYGIKGINSIADTNIPTLAMPSSEFSNALTDVGIPNPENPTERVVGDISRAVSGGGASIRAGNVLTQGALGANPYVNGFGDILTTAPKSQLASSASAALASGMTRENNGSPLAQFGASILGGVAPLAGISGFKAASNALSQGGASQEIIDAARSAQNFGIDIPAAQITRNPLVKMVDSTLPYIPLSGHGKELATAKDQFNRAVSQTFGENSTTLNRDTMEAAAQNIGKMYNDVLASTPNVKITDNALNRLAEIDQEAKDLLIPDEYNKISKQIANITDKAAANDGSLPAEVWHNFTKSNSSLSKLARQNSEASGYAYDLKSTLHDALGQSAPEELADKFRTANQYWKNYKTVNTLAEKNPVTGEINPSTLITQTNKASRKFGNKGMDDLQDLAGIGKTFFQAPASSGTAERVSLLKLGAGAGSAATAVAGGNPLAALGILGGIAGYSAAGRAASKAINSQWYKNKLLNAAPEQYGVGNYTNPFAASLLNNTAAQR